MKMTNSINIKTNFFELDPDNSEYKIDQSIICTKKILGEIPFLNYEPETYESPENIQWYPFVNTYYNYTEDVDALSRVNHLLSWKPSQTNLLEDRDPKSDDPHFYTEKDVQTHYLSTPPLCFIILGKPNIGEQELGKLIADYWNCVYIDPETLIIEEIESGSRVGQCIEFNLRCGRAIGIDIILRLVQKRVNTQSVLHRGFVLCGLPVIPNDLYEEDPVSTETAFFTVHDIFEEILESVMDLGQEADMEASKVAGDYEQPGEGAAPFGQGDEGTLGEAKTKRPKSTVPVIPPDIGTTEDNLCEPPDIGTDYEGQLNCIFDLFVEPFIILYIACSNEDVLSKREEYRYDIYSQKTIDLQKEKSDKLIFSYFSRDPTYNANQLSEEFFDAARTYGADSSRLQHLVRLPRNLKVNIISQLGRYHEKALDHIEKLILKHNHEFFLKLDGRTGAARMMNTIKWKLRTLNVQKVVIPEKLNAVDGLIGEGEGPGDSTNFDGVPLDDCFKQLCRKQIPSRSFRWTLSDWGFRCPVAMKEGELIEGDPNYAVHFMNKMFFLSNQEAFVKFYRNPRPYLLHPYPKPHGRIYVFGPICSGKTAVARCLGYLFNLKPLCPADMHHKFLKDKQHELVERVKQATIAEAIVQLDVARKEQLEDRKHATKSEINEWVEKFRKALMHEYRVLKRQAHSSIDTLRQVSSFPKRLRKDTDSDILSVLTEDSYMDLPILDSEEECLQLHDNVDMILEYAPPHIQEKMKILTQDPVPATAFDDYVQDAAKKAVKNVNLDAVKLTEDDLLHIFVTEFQEVEDRYMKKFGTRGGWIMDGMPLDLELLQQLWPDYKADHVIILKSNQIHFLIERFASRGQNIFLDYKNLFLELGKTEAALRVPSSISTDSFKTKMARDFLDDLLSADPFLRLNREPPGLDTRRSLEAYQHHLQDFPKECIQVMNFLEENRVYPIEIDVSNKSFPNLLKEVMKIFEDEFQQVATPFSEEDRADEVQDFGENAFQEEEAGEGGGEDTLMQNRRWGDSFWYCPVTLEEKWVLWKGKNDFAAKYLSKVYLFSSDKDMRAFLFNPSKYVNNIFPSKDPPPPRICIVGPGRSGKTIIAKALARNFGLCYINYADYIVGLEESYNYTQEDGTVINPIKEYLTLDQPLPEEVLKILLFKLWFEEPYQKIGFVLDDFPKRPSDVAFMVKHKTIPDLVISLFIHEGTLRTRFLEEKMLEWQIKIEEIQKNQTKRNQEILQEWELQRQKRFEQLMEVRRQHRYSSKLQKRDESGQTEEKSAEKSDKPERLEDIKETDEETEGSTVRTKSQVSYNSVDEQEDFNEVTRMLMAEMPEPVFEIQFESAEEATERFENEFDGFYMKDVDYIQAIKDACLVEIIPWKEVNSNLSQENVIYQSYVVLDPIKFRNKSHFERCYDISVEVAERLLSSGYYFLSKFGRTCPFQYYENSMPLQMFLPMEQKFNVYPTIHRYYIYFIVGKNKRELFKMNPLKYISPNKVYFPLIPLRMAIIGPPKCGKTALAERFRNEFGLKIITRGQAARHCLSYLSFSDVSTKMEEILRKGLPLTDELSMTAVEALCFDPRVVTQGCVFDGFPTNIHEMQQLANKGLVPQVMIDLHTEDVTKYDMISDDAAKLFEPPYSKRFLQHRYKVWKESATFFRNWTNTEYQNFCKVNINPSMWKIWVKSCQIVKATLFEIQHYYMHAYEDWPLRVSNMLVTPLEFLERQSSYKNYCPVCLHYTGKLNGGGEPPDRTGMVQYRQYLYWVCQAHIEEFQDTPALYLPPLNNHKMPDNLPQVPPNPNAPVHEDGFCVVCYKNERQTVKGSPNFAITYKGTTHYFDNLTCRSTFISDANAYCDIVLPIKGRSNYPSLVYQDLPVLGMLEQYVSKILVKAINSIVGYRPIIPGLTEAASALVGIGLYLKTTNENTNPQYAPYYREAFDLFQKKKKVLINYLAFMKRYRNPYLHYEEPLPQLKIEEYQRSECVCSEKSSSPLHLSRLDFLSPK